MDWNLQKQVSPDVPAHESPSTYIERASDADIDRNDSEFNPIGIASNEFHGLPWTPEVDTSVTAVS